jgi:hypothetical protein
MTDRPIIFSAPMVRALLDGRKTQTRRLAWRVAPYQRRFDDPSAGMTPGTPSPWQAVQPGDRLWVRESVRGEEHPEEDISGVRYLADDFWQPIANTEQASEDWLRLYTYATTDTLTGGKSVPSIHMPRWASRLTLTVTAVRLERLQEISEADAIAEGPRRKEGGYLPGTRGDHIGTFAALWNYLHQPPHAWEDNPEVVVISFGVAKRNIDA